MKNQTSGAAYKQPITFDASDEKEIWRTTEQGQHYRLDKETGRITAGFGGQLNGMRPDEVDWEGFAEGRYKEKKTRLKETKMVQGSIEAMRFFGMSEEQIDEAVNRLIDGMDADEEKAALEGLDINEYRKLKERKAAEAEKNKATQTKQKLDRATKAAQKIQHPENGKTHPYISGRFNADNAVSGEQAEHYAKLPDDITSNERAAVSNYTGENFKLINSHLRGQSYESKGIQETIRDLDSVLSRSVTDKDMVLYRGASRDLNLSKGDSFTEKGFSSTTARRGQADYFAGFDGVIMEIRLPKGSSAASIGNAKEDEILISRNTKFTVIGEEKTKVHGKETKKYILEVMP